MTNTIALGSYLFKRIRSIGVTKIWGVPGDYNLQTLDHLYGQDLEWVGTCNELNAGYACDGYARTSGGLPGVFVTTYAVGELSALNAVSGACAENVPIIHIVGTSARFFQDSHAVIHHAPAPLGLRPNNHRVYAELHDPFVCASEYIDGTANAPDQIDRVISEVLRTKMPGVIFLPIDMANLPVSDENLSQAIKPQWPLHPETDVVVDAILQAFANSHNPVIIADLFTLRFNLSDTVTALMERTGAKGFTTNLGKSAIDESHPQFYGVYNGKYSDSSVTGLVEQDSDFILEVGPLNSDSNTGAFSRNIDPKKHIAIHSMYARVFGKEYDGVHFVHVLGRVLEDVLRIDTRKFLDKPQLDEPQLQGELTQEQLPFLVSRILNRGDTLISETGTFQFNAKSVRLPQAARFFTQIFYSCIGFALPAAVGAGVAMKESKQSSKVVLIEGDGSAQMTIQELGTIVRHELPVTVIIINNEGYSIERAIWGPKQSYNDICPNWQWTKLFEVFGGFNVATYQVHSAEDFLKLAQNSAFRTSMRPQMVEVFLPKYDYPENLKQMIKVGQPRQREMAIAYHKMHDLNISMGSTK